MKYLSKLIVNGNKLLRFNSIPKAILILVLTQGISSLSSSLTSFSFDIWIYQKTGSYSIFALIAVFSALPNLIFSPIAGALVDRFSKKFVLIACECCSLSGIAIVLLTSMLNQLSVSHVAEAVITLALAETLRWPALSTTVSTFTPTSQLDRINGLIETFQGIATISGPLFGALFYRWLGLNWIILLNAVTYTLCILILFLIRFPIVTNSQQLSKKILPLFLDLFKDGFFGFKWIGQHPELLQLLFFFMFINFFISIFWVAYTPYLLSFTSINVLGISLALEGTGIFIGGLLFSIYGGLKRKEYGVFFGAVIAGACMIGFGLFRQPLLIYTMALVHGCTIPIINASNQTIWQFKVPLVYQGRVFSIRKMIAWSLNPIAILFSIPLVTMVFKPLNIVINNTQLSLKAWGIGQTGAFGLMISSLGTICFLGAIIIITQNKLSKTYEPIKLLNDDSE